MENKYIYEKKLCRECYLSLKTSAEFHLGIHVRCVLEVEQRGQHTIRNPSYGFTDKEN